MPWFVNLLGGTYCWTHPVCNNTFLDYLGIGLGQLLESRLFFWQANKSLSPKLKRTNLSPGNSILIPQGILRNFRRDGKLKFESLFIFPKVKYRFIAIPFSSIKLQWSSFQNFNRLERIWVALWNFERQQTTKFLLARSVLKNY